MSRILTDNSVNLPVTEKVRVLSRHTCASPSCLLWLFQLPIYFLSLPFTFPIWQSVKPSAESHLVSDKSQMTILSILWPFLSHGTLWFGFSFWPSPLITGDKVKPLNDTRNYQDRPYFLTPLTLYTIHACLSPWIVYLYLYILRKLLFILEHTVLVTPSISLSLLCPELTSYVYVYHCNYRMIILSIHLSPLVSPLRTGVLCILCTVPNCGPWHIVDA